MTRILALVLAAILTACAAQPADNRTRLAQTEVAATAAFKEITALANAGVIRKGSQTAVVIADAELVLAAAIRVWRTSPDDPKYAAAAINALPALLQLISNAKGQKTATWRNYEWARSHSFWAISRPSSRPYPQPVICITSTPAMMTG